MAEYTAQELLEGAARAAKVGDTAAAERLTRRAQEAGQAETLARKEAEDRERYKPSETQIRNPMSSNIIAGVERLAQGIGQTIGVGGVTPESVREADKRRAQLKELHPLGGALQFVGENAPGFLVPGGALLRGGSLVANVGRSALTGAASAGTLGYLGATGEEDVHGAKVRNALTAATVGAVASPVLGAALPGVTNWLRGVARRNVGAGIKGSMGERMAEREAQDVFSQNIADPSGSTAGVEAALQREINRPTPRIGGPASVGEAVGTDEAIRLEQLLRAKGGVAADPLRQQSAATDAAVMAELRRTQDPARLAQVEQDITAHNTALAQSGSPLQGPIFNPTGHDVDVVLQRAIDNSFGDVQRTLADVQRDWAAAVALANRDNTWAPLNAFRKNVLNDTTSRLIGENKPNVAKELNAFFNREVRPALDNTLDTASGGVSRQYFGQGSTSARLMAEREQLQTAEELNNWLTKQAELSRTGDPSAGTSAIYSKIQDLLQKENKYGNVPLSQAQQDILRAAGERLQGRRALESAEVGEIGAQAARALPRVSNLLQIAGRPPWTQQNVTTYMIGGLLTHPAVAATAFGGGIARQKAQAAIARELGNIAASPTAAMKALRDVSARAQALERRRRRQRRVGAGAAAVLGPEATRED